MLWRPLDSDSITNPYPMYKALRETSPVFKVQTGEWVITGYEEVKAILKDNRFLVGNKKEWLSRGIHYFNQKEIDFSPIADAINAFILLINPPEHTKIRKLVMSAWDDREVEQLVTGNVEYLLQQLSDRPHFDVVGDFASHLPAMTIAGIMGVPFENYVHLRNAGRNMIKAVDPYNTYRDFVLMDAAAQHFITYFSDHIERKTEQPENDLISKIIKLNSQSPEPLTEAQLISICIFLFIAGEETTISFISTSLLQLHAHQEQFKWLKGHWDQMPSAIEELLRYDGPVQLLGRVVGEDLEFCGHKLQQGEVTTLCLASANRDNHQFDQPDRLILSRTPNRHLAFGSGIHFCLGDWLAKKQGSIALTRFLQQFPGYRVDTNSIKWNKNLSIRSLQQIIVDV